MQLRNFDRFPLSRTMGISFSLHPLVHAWKRDTLSASEQKMWAQVALNTLMQSTSLQPEGNSDLNGQFHRDLLPHLRARLRDHGDPITPLVQSIFGILSFPNCQALTVYPPTYHGRRGVKFCQVRLGFFLGTRPPGR